MQTAFETIRVLRSLGLKFHNSEGQLAVAPQSLITADARAAIRTHRDCILQLIELEKQPPCVHDVLERAAILEFVGGYSRKDADRLALGEFGLASYDQAALPALRRAAHDARNPYSR